MGFFYNERKAQKLKDDPFPKQFLDITSPTEFCIGETTGAKKTTSNFYGSLKTSVLLDLTFQLSPQEGDFITTQSKPYDQANEIDFCNTILQKVSFPWKKKSKEHKIDFGKNIVLYVQKTHLFDLLLLIGNIDAIMYLEEIICQTEIPIKQKLELFEEFVKLLEKILLSSVESFEDTCKNCPETCTHTPKHFIHFFYERGFQEFALLLRKVGILMVKFKTIS